MSVNVCSFLHILLDSWKDRYVSSSRLAIAAQRALHDDAVELLRLMPTEVFSILPTDFPHRQQLADLVNNTCDF